MFLGKQVEKRLLRLDQQNQFPRFGHLIPQRREQVNLVIAPVGDVVEVGQREVGCVRAEPEGATKLDQVVGLVRYWAGNPAR